MECAYGGYRLIDDNICSCSCEDNSKRFVRYDEFLKKNSHYVTESDNEECEHFIPHIEIEGDNIEIETIFNIHHKCPHCGYEDTECEATGEGCKFIDCFQCGKKYRICWCLY